MSELLATRKYIKSLRRNFINVSAEAKKIILEQLGSPVYDEETGFYHEFTEQDIWEQSRKIINAHPVKTQIPDFLK